MNAVFRHPIALAVIALLGLMLVFSSFSIVPETRQAVVLRLNEPYQTVNAYKPGEQFGRTGSGVLFHIPFVDRVVWVDKRILSLDLSNQPVLSTDQQRIEVDAFARFRVVNPLRMAISVGSVERLTERLQPLFSSALRNELGKQPFSALLSAERGQVMDNIQKNLQAFGTQYGVEIVDVRIKHADLPTGSPLDSAYDRMRTARQQEAATIRAQGLKEAQIIRATALAEAAQIYAAATNKDPKFYDFFRAMQSYRTTFIPAEGKGETNIILSPQNSYLKEFMGQR
ncbi:protease modulator HflC [Sphingomonas soli]|uniref:protease modulator HflC n=1 Tax=Sphingomonas soli TaxID=266127 RepID=UPI0008321D21|nr:protease modulator HflC [Sphingomonas soli]